jgi:hypothetical protein
VRVFSNLDNDNYLELIEWLGYPAVDYLEFIQDPYKFLDWVATAEPIFANQMRYLKQRNVLYFIREIYQRLSGEDLTDYSSKWRDIKTWVAIAFDDYPLGADPHFTQKYIKTNAD